MRLVIGESLLLHGGTALPIPASGSALRARRFFEKAGEAGSGFALSQEIAATVDPARQDIARRFVRSEEVR